MAGGRNVESEVGVRRRPLWLAGFAALLTASLVVWAVLLGWLTYDNARLEEAHAFEDDRSVKPPAAFTGDWLADAALAFPRVALIMLCYALPLVALTLFLERCRSGTVGPLAGAAAAAPLVLIWLALVALSPHLVPWQVIVLPAVLLAGAGALGGTSAAAVRYGRSR